MGCIGATPVVFCVAFFFFVGKSSAFFFFFFYVITSEPTGDFDFAFRRPGKMTLHNIF